MGQIFEQLNLDTAAPLNPKTVTSDRTAISALQVYNGLVLYDTSTPSGVYVYTGLDGTNVETNWDSIGSGSLRVESGGNPRGNVDVETIDLVGPNTQVTQSGNTEEATFTVETAELITQADFDTLVAGNQLVSGRYYEIDDVAADTDSIPADALPVIEIDKGGTGATTLAAAQTALGIVTGGGGTSIASQPETGEADITVANGEFVIGTIAGRNLGNIYENISGTTTTVTSTSGLQGANYTIRNIESPLIIDLLETELGTTTTVGTTATGATTVELADVSAITALNQIIYIGTTFNIIHVVDALNGNTVTFNPPLPAGIAAGSTVTIISPGRIRYNGNVVPYLSDDEPDIIGALWKDGPFVKVARQPGGLTTESVAVTNGTNTLNLTPTTQLGDIFPSDTTNFETDPGLVQSFVLGNINNINGDFGENVLFILADDTVAGRVTIVTNNTDVFHVIPQVNRIDGTTLGAVAFPGLTHRFKWTGTGYLELPDISQDVFPSVLELIDVGRSSFLTGEKNRILSTNTHTGNFTIGLADSVGDGADVSGSPGTSGQVTVIQNQSGVSKTLIYKTGTGQPQLLPLLDDSFTQLRSNGNGWVIIGRSVRQGGNVILDTGSSLTFGDATTMTTAVVPAVFNFRDTTQQTRIWTGTQAQFDTETEITDGTVVYNIYPNA